MADRPHVDPPDGGEPEATESKGGVPAMRALDGERRCHGHALAPSWEVPHAHMDPHVDSGGVG